MKMQTVPAYTSYMRDFKSNFQKGDSDDRNKEFLCVNGVECVVPHLIDKKKRQILKQFFNWLLCVYVCDFSLYTEHITLPFFCMLRHIYVNPSSIQNPLVVQPRWQWLEFSNESLPFPTPREKPNPEVGLRLLSSGWKAFGLQPPGARLALKQSRNKNSRFSVVLTSVALLLQETLGVPSRGCYFSPVFAVISRDCKDCQKWGLQQESQPGVLACCR